MKHEIKTEIEGAIAGSGICVRIASPNERYGGDRHRISLTGSLPTERVGSRSNRAARPDRAIGNALPMRSPMSTIASSHS